MSISSQPSTRQAAMQRSRSSLLGAASYDTLIEPQLSKTFSVYDNLQQSSVRTSSSFAFSPLPTCDPTGRHYSSQHQTHGSLPGLASQLAAQLQSQRQDTMAGDKPASPPERIDHQTPAQPIADFTEHMACNAQESQAADCFAIASAEAASLTTKLAAFKAGQHAVREKAALASAAKQTAYKVAWPTSPCLPVLRRGSVACLQILHCWSVIAAWTQTCCVNDATSSQAFNHTLCLRLKLP